MTPGRSPAYGLLASPHPSRGPQQPVLASPGRQGGFGGGPGGPPGSGVYSGRITTQQVRQVWGPMGTRLLFKRMGPLLWARAAGRESCHVQMRVHPAPIPSFCSVQPPSSLASPSVFQDKMLEGRSITIRKGPFRGMRGRVISATATHVRLELEAQMKTVTVDRWAGACS